MTRARGSRSATTPPKIRKTTFDSVNTVSTIARDSGELSIPSTAKASAIDDIDPAIIVMARERKNQRNPVSFIAARPRVIGALRVSASVHPAMPGCFRIA
jgi:hypothetical protein